MDVFGPWNKMSEITTNRVGGIWFLLIRQGSDSTRMIRMIILNIRQNILAGLVD